MGPEEIDGIWVGSCSPSLFVNQEHVAPLGLEVAPEALRFVHTTRTEGACASSSVALYNAIYGIESGRFKRVLVIGVEKMNLLCTGEMTHALACSSHWPSEGARGMTFPGLFAEYAKGYQAHYQYGDGELRQMLAAVSALCYRNGFENPLAHFSKGSPPDKLGLTTAEAILGCLTRGRGQPHDCAAPAAARLLAGHRWCGGPGHRADRRGPVVSDQVVEIAGIGLTTERMAINARSNMHELTAGKKAIEKSFDEAGISLEDVDFAEVHDCFTINQILSVEALGLSAGGQGGWDFINGRYTPGDVCPINLSGGLKSKGHPVGATGASMHALAYKQLVGQPIGEAPRRGQPEIGVVFNVGGSAVTNCATTLRRIA